MLTVQAAKFWTTPVVLEPKRNYFYANYSMQTTLYPDTAAIVSKIWSDFKFYYDFITDCKLDSSSAYEAFEKAKNWIELFCSLRHTRPGYTRPRITPYMHIMCYHVPFFIQQYGCFKKFTGQGVEKNNDAKRVLFQKSNKCDAAKDILFMESRQWDLKEHECNKGTYTKRNSEYWNVEISNQRKKRMYLQMQYLPTRKMNLLMILPQETQHLHWLLLITKVLQLNS